MSERMYSSTEWTLVVERDEARAIARRLARAIHIYFDDGYSGDDASRCMDVLYIFDALPWAKDDA